MLAVFKVAFLLQPAHDDARIDPQSFSKPHNRFPVDVLFVDKVLEQLIRNQYTPGKSICLVFIIVLSTVYLAHVTMQDVSDLVEETELEFVGVLAPDR